MEKGFCCICGKSGGKLLFSGEDLWYHKPGFFSIYQCCNCKSYYLDPRPSLEEYSKYYPEEYEPFQNTNKGLYQEIKHKISIWKQVSLISRYKRGGTVLDVGCGNGSFISALKIRGWQTYGLEVNASLAERLRKRGLNVFVGEFSKFDFEDKKFDLITFWDVLEHLSNPIRTLKIAASISAPGGVLVVSIPNPGSIEAKVFGPYWAGWDIPRHLWLAPIPVLISVIEGSGWKVCSVYYRRGRLWLLRLSLRFFMEASSVPPFLSLFDRLLSSSLAEIIFFPIFAVFEHLGLGSIAVIIAKRKDFQA